MSSIFFNTAKYALLFTLSLASWLSAETSQKTKNEMIHCLEGIHHIFETSYAPIEWKQKRHQWDLDHEISQAKNFIQESSDISTKDFQRLVKKILNSARDYHVSAVFYSTEMATLPIGVKGVGDKYYIVSIDRTRLPEGCMIQLGDELVSFGGRPTHEVVKEIRENDLAHNNSATDQALAELCLTKRSGARGMKVPRGSVVIRVKSLESEKEKGYQLMWDYFPEIIKNPSYSIKASSQEEVLCENFRFLKHQMFSPTALQLSAHLTLSNPFEKDTQSLNFSDEEIYNPNLVGYRKSFVPPLGKIIWEILADVPFYAYIFENAEGRRIGYVRIPHYMMEPMLATAVFAEVIKGFEAKTEAMVIDQVNNDGGNIFYMYALASMLTNQPLHTPKHRILNTHKDILEALAVLQALESIESNIEAKKFFKKNILGGYPVSYQVAKFIEQYARFTVEEWNEGRRYTRPHYIGGVDLINPHATANYTKPILALGNELDFSCGDVMLAILQDNKRATIFGTRTAGAGGCVSSYDFPNRFGIESIYLTSSMAERIDEGLIENIGVTPDIEYQLTEEDIRFGYQGYVQAVNDALNTILPPPQKKEENKERRDNGNESRLSDGNAN